MISSRFSSSRAGSCDPSFGDPVRLGCPHRVPRIRMPSLANTASKTLVNLLSRSRINTVNSGAKHEDFRVFRLGAAGQQSEPGHDLSEDQIQQSYRHGRRSCPTTTVQRCRRPPSWMSNSAPTGWRAADTSVA